MPKLSSSEMAADIRRRAARPAVRVTDNAIPPAENDSSPPRASAMPHIGSNERGLTDTQKMLIEQRVANERPSAGAAYLLDIFFGSLGLHRFYLGATGSAIAMLLLSISFIGLVVSIPWAFIDLFLIPGIVRRRSDEIRQRLTIEELTRP